MDQEACCTCATLLSQVPQLDPSSSSLEKQKQFPDNRQLECCRRVICGGCIHKNPRFNTYCPYCQTSSSPSSIIPRGGLKEPPSYQTSITSSSPQPPAPPVTESEPPSEPPPYTSTPPPDTLPPAYSAPPNPITSPNEKNKQTSSSSTTPNDPILHFLNHTHDTIQSLSLRYKVPISLLRTTNRLTSDHLLLARRTILIPQHQSHPPQPSLSPRPIEGEEEETRKSKLRRWMVACKVSDYDVALLYLEQAGYDLDQATEAYFADEAWERDHPLVSGDEQNGNSSSSSRNQGLGNRDKMRVYHRQRLFGMGLGAFSNFR